MEGFTQARYRDEAARSAEQDAMRVTRFDGTFELGFLKDDEGVRSAGKDSNAIEILDRDGNVIARASVGDLLVRNPDDSIRIISAVANLTAV